ncbi:MAG: V-type ATPase subunit [Sedimentisphaerales bacterium]|nr:V-type ATPase subunit [Sedimentisphaerales bacterium]
MSSRLSKYAFVNAKLRARVSKILPDETFSQLAKAPSLDAALALLRETPFASLERTYSATGDLKQAELELLKTEIELYRNVRQHVHPDCLGLLDALLSQFEIDNLKNAIRIFFDRNIRKRRADASEHYILYERILHDIPFDLVVNASSFDAIAGVCSGTPYSAIIRKYGLTVESEGSLFRLELAFDHYYYKTLLSAIEKLGQPDRGIALRLAGVEIDLQNIRWIIRFRNFYDLSLEAVMAAIVPGGFNLSQSLIDEMYRAQNVTTMLRGFVRSRYPGLSTLLASETTDTTSRLLLIRRIMEEIMKHEVQRILTGYPFTIGIILAYFLMKKRELNRLRIILNAKQYGVEQERIESML